MISYVIRTAKSQQNLTSSRKYQFMEANQQRRAAGLKDKMPDIQKTLDTVRFLKTRKVRIEHISYVGEVLTNFDSLVRSQSRPCSS